MPAVQMPYKALEKRMVALLLGSIALWFLSAFFLSGKNWAAGMRYWSVLWALLLGIWIGAGWNRE